MCKEQKQSATLFVMKPGVELLETCVADGGKVRIIIFRDTREGIDHSFQLEFLKPDGIWAVIFSVGERKLNDAIELFTQARDFVKANPPPAGNE